MSIRFLTVPAFDCPADRSAPLYPKTPRRYRNWFYYYYYYYYYYTWKQ